MTSEGPDTSGEEIPRDSANVVSGSGSAAERLEHDICVQTGEEFSTEFLRDRVSPRRVSVMTDMDQHQLKRVGYNCNQNHQLVHEDLTGILGRCGLVSDFGARKGYTGRRRKQGLFR
ncbi:hypothetical protein L1049_017707 [Liquidambar formosana]|uniref:Uncharacterized protein n=1 Tax=Liquidambar formosana TaxID=63359 RepID=A0AAP0S189_LIQFO